VFQVSRADVDEDAFGVLDAKVIILPLGKNPSISLGDDLRARFEPVHPSPLVFDCVLHALFYRIKCYQSTTFSSILISW